MRVIAPAKINLHLEVLGLRQDGFHELAMVMQSIDLADSLELTSREDGLISLDCDDPTLSTDGDNLICRAASLLRNRSGGRELGVSIYLKKQIPIGAGLAGGSSDGAAALVALNSFWGLGFALQELEEMGSEIGSDLPFCIKGGTQFCFGRGEKLEPLPSNNNSLAIVLVKDPFVSVSTPWAYGQHKKKFGESYFQTEASFEKRRELLRDEFNWSAISDKGFPVIRNDLQRVVEPCTEAVKKSLEILASMPNSIVSAMSGSGPSCFAIFPDFNSAEKALNQSQNHLTSAGLKAWCCSFKPEGVKIIS